MDRRGAGWYFGLINCLTERRGIVTDERPISAARLFCRRLDQEERKLSNLAIRGARCRRGRTLRNDRVSRHGGFPLRNDQYDRRAQACRGIEGRLSATRSRSLADNE